MRARKTTVGLHHQSGLTLVEIMVALTIGLVLTAGTIQLFVGSKQTYRLQEAMSRIQESGRFAIELLNEDLRWGGNIGCLSNMRRENPVGTGILAPGYFRVALNNPNDFEWSLETAIQGHYWDGSNWQPTAVTLPAAVSGVARADSDIVTIRGASSSGLIVTAHPGGSPPGSANIAVASGNGLQQNEVLLVGDCTSAAALQITNSNPDTSGSIVHDTGAVSSGPGNATKALGREFVGADVMRLATRTYFIGTGVGGGPALFRRVNQSAVEELVEGVSRMVITYGVDTNANREVDVYQTGAQVEAGNNWGNVVSIRISLLLQSDDGVTDAAQYVTFNGASTTAAPGDRRMRDVYTTTIASRNRLPCTGLFQ